MEDWDADLFPCSECLSACTFGAPEMQDHSATTHKPPFLRPCSIFPDMKLHGLSSIHFSHLAEVLFSFKELASLEGTQGDVLRHSLPWAFRTLSNDWRHAGWPAASSRNAPSHQFIKPHAAPDPW